MCPGSCGAMTALFKLPKTNFYVVNLEHSDSIKGAGNPFLHLMNIHFFFSSVPTPKKKYLGLLGLLQIYSSFANSHDDIHKIGDVSQ